MEKKSMKFGVRRRNDGMIQSFDVVAGIREIPGY